MDKIVLKDMIFHGFHGTKDFEKEIGQKIIITIELFLDLKKPGKTDDLKDTVDYQEIYKLINSVQARKKYDLLEALAETRSEEHTSELQSHSFISYAVFCLKKKNIK